MRRAFGVVAVVAVALAGCGWAHPRSDLGNTGSDPFETTISGVNVAGLAEQFRLAVDAPGSAPPLVVARGHVFAGARTTGAFDAAGVDGCGGAPRTCTAQWRLDGGGIPDAYDRVLYVGSGAYDADGETGCSGAPKTCVPMWIEGIGSAGGQTGATDPTALHLARHGSSFGRGGVLASIYGYERDCGSTPSDCPLRWAGETLSGFGTDVLSRPATDGSRVFAAYTSSATATAGTLYAWDGTRANGPRLWSAVLPGRSTDFVAVADGVVVAVVQTPTGSLLVAYDAAGVTNCTGVPGVCQPLWESDLWQGTGSDQAPAIADGVVYRSTGGRLAAYDLHGATGCSGASVTCSSMWDGGSTAELTAPSVANGLVFVGDSAGRVLAFDARGMANCSATIRQCAPLWSAATGAATGAPVITGGRVYVGVADGTVRVFGPAG